MTVTLIEGVGDEVTLFFVLALLAAVACLAWWTTRVTDRPLRIQTIIVGQRVIHVDERGEPTAAAAAIDREGEGAEPPPGPAEPEPSCEEDRPSQVELVPHEQRSSADGAASDGPGEQVTAVESPSAPPEDATPAPAGVRQDSGTAERAAETDPAEPASSLSPDLEPDQTSDPAPDDVQQLRRRRLAFMAGQPAESATQTAPAPSGSPDTQPASTDTPADAGRRTAADREPEQTALDTAPDTTAQGTASDTTEAAERTSEAAASPGGPQTIMVKLKFLNDTQRLVEGSRAEPLADFKRRHFPTETAANRIVRLIFNGRLLPDQETLGQCGLYHNCVVHCHVSSGPGPAAGQPAAAAAAAAGPELDIGVLLYPVLTSVVTLVWGLRLRYPELFSGTAVLLLAVLTLLLACFAAATFLPLERLPGAAAAAGAAEGRQQQRGR